MIVLNILDCQEFNKVTAENFAARLKQTNLLSKTSFGDKLINFDNYNYNTRIIIFFRQNVFYKR